MPTAETSDLTGMERLPLLSSAAKVSARRPRRCRQEGRTGGALDDGTKDLQTLAAIPARLLGKDHTADVAATYP